MRKLLPATFLLLLSAAAWSDGLPPGLAGEVTRALDGFRPALERAVNDAGKGDLRALQQSLKRANEVWVTLYSRYHGIIPNDPNWDEDLDSINSAMRAAVNDVSPNANAAGAKKHLDEASATLQALRARNRVPDVQTALRQLLESVRAMQTATRSLRGKQLEPADAAQLQQQWQTTAEAWKQFSEAVVEVNALGLEPRRLEKMKALVALQDRAFEKAKAGIEMRDRFRVLAGLHEAESPLLRLQMLLTAIVPQR